MSKTALVTGVTGQDGAYLTRFLLEKGYAVHGLIRRSSIGNTQRLDRLVPPESDLRGRFTAHFGDMTDAGGLTRIVERIEPDEIYNLAAQSHVRVSFDLAEYTADVDALGPLRLLEAVRAVGAQRSARFYQASTSELFGQVRETPQRESTPFAPRSPYGAAKLFAYWSVVNYREAYDMFAVNGILFNHESPFRGESFITRKITLGAARIRFGLQKKIMLGNLEARRDWGHAADYVEGMWLMLQQPEPDDFVLATGQTRSVRSLAVKAFEQTGVSLQWRGSGVQEEGFDAATGRTLIEIDPQFYRPAEVDLLCGDASKAREKLLWRPKHSFDELIDEMVRSDLALVEKSL